MPSYTKTVWQDLPNTTTPVNATNLNNIENGIEAIDNDVSAINNNIGDLTNLETTVTNNLVGAINSLVPTLLWSNPNPTSSFEAQNITLSSSNYDILEFYFKSLDTNSNILSVRTVKGKSANLQSLLLDGTKIDIVLRTATYVNDTQYSISAGNIVQVPSTSNVFNTNTQCIPVYVIGYKTNLFN